MQNERQAGFSLLEVMLSIVAIGIFMMLAIDPYLDLRTKQINWEQETKQLEQMATDQVENRTVSYVLKQGAWCNETTCLASGIRNDPPRTIVRPVDQSVAPVGDFDADTTRSPTRSQSNE